MKKFCLIIWLVFLVTVAAHAAEQQSKQATITLELTATCVLNVDEIQGFGAWPTGDENITGVNLGTITVTCADGMSYAVGIDAGEHYDGGSRRLSNGVDYLSYVLRSQSSSGPEWGDTGLTALYGDYVPTHPAQAVQEVGNGSTQSFTLWGDATVADATGGTYQDRVNIILVW